MRCYLSCRIAAAEADGKVVKRRSNGKPDILTVYVSARGGKRHSFSVPHAALTISPISSEFIEKVGMCCAENVVEIIHLHTTHSLIRIRASCWFPFRPAVGVARTFGKIDNAPADLTKGRRAIVNLSADSVSYPRNLINDLS